MTRNLTPGRRAGAVAAAVAVAAVVGTALIAGCAAPPAPQLLSLRLAPPVERPAGGSGVSGVSGVSGAAAAATVTAAAAAAANPLTHPARVQLLQPVRLPELLDRDAVLVSQGSSGQRALPGWRWAEPLRDAVPRLLQHDLGLLLGTPDAPAQVLSAPLPAGWLPAHQLRVELLQLQADAAQRSVTVQARWTVVVPATTAAVRAPSTTPSTTAPPPRIEQAMLRVEASSDQPDALATAHRLALWRLAERIAPTLR